MRKIRTLVRKEILDILRDKKTLVMMVVVPVLLYPLIIIGMSIGISMIMTSQENTVHTVGYPAQYEELAQSLRELYGRDREEIGQTLEFEAAEPGRETEIREETDVWMEPQAGTGDALKINLYYSSTEENSRYAEEALETVLESYREELLADNLKQAGLDEDFLYPVSFTAKDSATVSESFGMDIGGSIGLMLIVTILLGAVYPAIDATAGEKERGTLETLLTLPVTNFQMILSKYVSVALFACVTAVISLLSLGGSVLFLMFGVSDELAAEMQGVSLGAIFSAVPILLVTLLATALLITAVCMCFCLFAKSFKEANNYVTPVMLIVMFASMVGMLPSVKLDYRTALIPIVNVSLMVKQVLAQQFEPALAGMVIGVNLACSVVIIWILAKLYDSENILFSDGFSSIRLFRRRSEIRKGTTPDLGDLVISITALLLLLLYVGSAASVRLGFAGIAVNQLLILVVPLLVVWYMKSDVRTLFCLKKPEFGSCLGALVLYIGVYCLVLLASAWMSSLLPGSTENVYDSYSVMEDVSLPLLLLVVSAMPAVGEELLFRGFLFGSLRIRLGGKGAEDGALQSRAGAVGQSGGLSGKKRLWCAILISAVVFGAFHMSLVKLLPTAILGTAFAYLVYGTGSIYVTMALHFLNNAVAMAAMKYPEEITKVLPLLGKDRFSLAETAGLLAAGAALTLAGAAIVRKTSKQRLSPDNGL